MNRKERILNISRKSGVAVEELDDTLDNETAMNCHKKWPIILMLLFSFLFVFYGAYRIYTVFKKIR
ncbi:MAG: hypothetical protein ACLRVU_00305 [Beduini sp.]|uniref:hypothetical protein n=1 Tax=Beduini sp. TaxID=1922300 RepID=UPI0039A342C4